MMTKTDTSKPVQADLFKVILRDLVAKGHELVLFRAAIDWQRFERGLEPAYCSDNGRPSILVRMMVGLTFLKYIFGLSDQGMLDNWCENPYWQYFCVGEFFEHKPPTDQGTMSQDNDTPGKDKIYSVHEPQVECIAKGKVHKRYEFGVKAGDVTDSKSNWVVWAMALPGNPYDGNTLAQMLKQSVRGDQRCEAAARLLRPRIQGARLRRRLRRAGNVIANLDE